MPRFFTPHEYRTVRTLVDLILPADERSGSATDAGVPEFLDFMMIDQPLLQIAMRGGLAWIDLDCGERFGKRFADGTREEQGALLDLISWPDRAPDELSHGVEFFNRFRDLTATGLLTPTEAIGLVAAFGIPIALFVGLYMYKIRKGRVEFKVEKAGIVQVPVGKVSFDAAKLFDNASAIIESVIKAKPVSCKGRYLKSVTISSTMGPGVKLDAIALMKQWS